MQVLRLLRAAPLRYAAAFALLSSVVMAAVLAVIYWWTSTVLERHLDEVIEQQLAFLRADFEQDGLDSLLGLVRSHTKVQADSPVHYLVKDRAGRVLAGDLPAARVGEGWHDITLLEGRGGNARHTLLRGRGAWLDDDVYVLVTNDTADLRGTQRLILRSFAIALGATVLVALAGGLGISGVLLRRVEAVNRTARRIMEGDLSQRVPTVGRRDELGGLAEVLNRMLGRIEELMGNLRHVTNDIAHDLRTPLGRLRQRLEAVRVRPRTAAEYEGAIDAAIEDTDEVLKTFDAMLRIAEIEAGARRASFTEVALDAVAETVVDAFAPVAEDEGRRLEARVEPGTRVHGDASLLTQLLANLVENALRHTPAGTRVEVAVERGPGGRTRLGVSDDGPGVPEGERERVLRRFYRLDSARSTPGSGLGLSLVAAVARLHGATVTLSDAGPGLRVEISFPPEEE